MKILKTIKKVREFKYTRKEKYSNYTLEIQMKSLICTVN